VLAADYIQAVALRAGLIARAGARFAAFDGVIMPTVPIVAPRIADLADDDAFTRTNLIALRNPTLVNMLDGCAISLPIHRADEAPVGLMLASSAGTDHRLLEIAAGLEDLFANVRIA
jgi:aspartyl-tRNA(Asn)/glutamyl-tRNA(Gln) amidotransferase subunit A